jgi:TPR repeat protein
MKKPAVILVLMLGLASPAWADIDKGTKAYKAKNFTTAYREFLSAAKAGNARAKVSVAVMHMRGQGVKIDFDVALRWLREAAVQGDGDARILLGDLYSRDIPAIKDHIRSYVWLTLVLAKVRAKKRENTLKILHNLRPPMTPEEIERAQDIAQQWNELDKE